VVVGVDEVELLGLDIPGQSIGDAHLGPDDLGLSARLPAVELTLPLGKDVAFISHGATIEATIGIGFGIIDAVVLDIRLHFEEGANHLGHRRDSIPLDDDGSPGAAHSKLLGFVLDGQNEGGKDLALDFRLVHLVLLEVVAINARRFEVHVVQTLTGHIPVGSLA